MSKQRSPVPGSCWERERDRETNHSVYQRQNQWMFKHQTASNIKNNALLNLIKLDTINYACIGYK